MPGPRIVLANGGRVDTRDASMLSDGELILATDAYYKPNSPTVWMVPGRQEITTGADDPIWGVRFLEFDAGQQYLVTMVGADGGSKYRIATAALAGVSFSDLVTGLAGTSRTLEAVHFANVQYLLNGVDRNRAVEATGTARFHGMLANIFAPTLLVGTQTGFILGANKTIKYWIEERVKDADGNILRRNGEDSSHVVTLTGTGATEKPRLYHNAFANSDTTHWALYGTATNGEFPVGAEIAEATVATAFIEDTRTGTDPAIPSGATYETLTVVLNGVSSPFSKNGPAPIGTTGDIFENAFVVNDTTNPRRVWFSFTDNAEIFPFLYYFDFNEAEYDRVVCIKTVGETCVVLLRDSAWRLNTLPSFRDNTFSPERSKKQIDGAFGVVNALAAALFSFGDGLKLAYVSPYGLVVTDTSRWDVLTDDVDWEANVDLTALDEIRLRNNPALYRLEMTYRDVTTGLLKQMFLHYHPSHAKLSSAGGLRAKCTWPINRPISDSTWMILAGHEHGNGATGAHGHMIGGGANGRLYLHDSGSSEPVGPGGINYEILSGDVYVNYVGGHATLRRLLVHHQRTAGQTGKAVIITRNSKQDDKRSTADISLDWRQASNTQRQSLGESFQVGFTASNTTGQVGVDYFAMDLENAGIAESR